MSNQPLGECMECGAPADRLGITMMSCYACGSDEIRAYSNDEVMTVTIDTDALIEAIRCFGEAVQTALSAISKLIEEQRANDEQRIRS